MSGLHVAVIMDGNGRWAQERGMPRWRGHIAGLDSVREIVRAAPAMGVETLTLYAFSSDNWKRPAGEIRKLFWLLREYSRKERDELVERGVRVTMIGRRDRLPTGSRFAIERLEKITQNGTTLNLRLAIDYSARSEITRAIREAVEQGTSHHRRDRPVPYPRRSRPGSSDSDGGRAQAFGFSALGIRIYGILFHSGRVAGFSAPSSGSGVSGL